MPAALPAPPYFNLPKDGGRASNIEGLQTWDDMLEAFRQVATADVVTIAGGAVTATAARLRLQPETGTADDLDSIGAGNVLDGFEVLLSTNSASDAVTVKNAGVAGDGRILTADGVDVLLDSPLKILRLRRSGAAWEEVGRSGFPAAGGGGAADTDLPIASAKTSNFSLSASEFDKVTPVDTTSDNVTISIPQGIATPAGKRRVAIFEKTVAANSMIFAVAGGGGGSIPTLLASQTFKFSTESSTTVAAGTESAFTAGHSFDVPAGDDVVLCVDVIINFKDAGSRSTALQVDGSGVSWTASHVHANAEDAPIPYHYVVGLGDVASTVTKNLKLAGVATGLRSYLMFVTAWSGADQAAPTDSGMLCEHQTTGTTSAVKGITTLGTNRTVQYRSAAKRNGTSTASIANATQIEATTSGTAGVQGNLCGAMARENAATAGAYDATIQFSASQRWAEIVYALKPAAAGGMTLKTPGAVSPTITAINKQVIVQYDGNADTATLAF